MSWAQMDDGFHDHPKTLALMDSASPIETAAAVGLWTLMLTWAKSHADPQHPERSGHIPAGLVFRTMGGKVLGERLANLLVNARAGRDHGLWEIDPSGGWRIHDFAAWQELDRWQARSEAGRKGARARWKQTGPALFGDPLDPHAVANATAQATAQRPHVNGNATAMPTTPHPTPPHTRPKTSPSPRAARRMVDDDDPGFAAFWAAYPRKRDKQDARRAWPVAIGQAPVSRLVAGAQTYAAECEAAGRDKQHMKLPATWLSKGSWDNELETAGGLDDGPNEAGTW
jgi:hypothetical protein